MRYGSVCSGIESVSVAVEPLGWEAEWFAEIEPFPCAVLAHHYPEIPNHGDMTRLPGMVLRGEIPAPDVMVGGTPCQAFSVAGMRKGLEDARGQLSITFVELADAIDHVRTARGDDECITWWENVPGVLSDKGNAFGCFLAALVGESEPLEPAGGRWTDAGCVYGPKRSAAWRVLDAQYFGLAQRRRRVFVVASARRGFDPAAVLFESEGVRRDTAPRREAGKSFTHDIALCLVSSGRGVERTGDTRGQDPVVDVTCMAHGQGGAEVAVDRTPTLTCNHEAPIVVHGTQDPIVSINQAHTLGRNSGQENVLAFSCKDYGADAGEPAPTLRAMGHGDSHANAGGQVAVCVTGDITHTLKAEGFDGSEDGTGRGQPIIACREVAQTLTSNYGKQVDNSDTGLGPNVVAVALRGREGGATAELGDDLAGCLRASTGGGDKPHALVHSAVRRLTPIECERLQGFPDNWTQIPWRNKPADECPDGPRYKAIGNSKAVPVVRWIARRIQQQIRRHQ